MTLNAAALKMDSSKPSNGRKHRAVTPLRRFVD